MEVLRPAARPLKRGQHRSVRRDGRHCRGRCIWRLGECRNSVHRRRLHNQRSGINYSWGRPNCNGCRVKHCNLQRRNFRNVRPGKGRRGHSVLNASSNYTGGTTISGGQVVISTDSALGDPSGPLMLNGGTLIIGAFIVSSRPFATLVPSAIDTGASNLTLPSTSNAGLTKFGNGKLTLQGSASARGPLLSAAAHFAWKMAQPSEPVLSRLPPQRASNSATPP